MRGLYSSKTKIRHQIFTEIARLAYEGDIEKEMDDLPYKILPGEIATYRDSIFLERAIGGERLRVSGTSLSGGLSQAGYPHGKRAVCDQSGEMHQMWKVSGILSI